MPNRPLPTRFADFGRSPARFVLIGLLLAIVGCVAISLSPLRKGYQWREQRGEGDVALYRAEVKRIAAGEGYYEAAAAELRQRGYPTQSVFNWRTPLPMWLIGKLPSLVWAKVLLSGLALFVLLLSFELLGREGGPVVSVVGVVWMLGALYACLLGDLVVLPSLWAGVLIALSALALGLGWTRLGVAGGITAVFMRDLAGPYCVIMLGDALWRRRWREAVLWIVGLAAYALFFAMHVHQLSQLRTAADHAQTSGWVQFGWIPFLISATQMHGFLILVVHWQWTAAIYLPLAVLGLVAWKSDAGHKVMLASLGYLALFAVVGQDLNQYWGLLFTPILCLGAAFIPTALRDLWQAATQDQSSGAGNSTVAES